MIDKIKRPFADILYAVGVKDADTYLPSNEEIQKLIQQAQQQSQQAQQAAKENPPAEEVYKRSQAALNEAKIEQIKTELTGADAETQLDYMAMAQGKPKVYN
jgi:hypothetical protein